MNRTESVWCLNCDHEHECRIISEEDGEYTDIPDKCEACGEPFNGAPADRREDFHADG